MQCATCLNWKPPHGSKNLLPFKGALFCSLNLDFALASCFFLTHHFPSMSIIATRVWHKMKPFPQQWICPTFFLLYPSATFEGFLVPLPFPFHVFCRQGCLPLSLICYPHLALRLFTRLLQAEEQELGSLTQVNYEIKTNCQVTATTADIVNLLIELMCEVVFE